MRLTRDQFERGIIAWSDGRFPVRTATMDDEGRIAGWSALHRDHRGTPVTSPPGTPYAIDFDVGIRVPERILPEARWTYQNSRGVFTTVLTPSTGALRTFQHALGYGVFHRMVIFTPHLTWNQDHVLWTPDLLIRFTSEVSGYRVRPTAAIDEQGKDPQLLLEYSQPHILTGRFVEIIAQGIGEIDDVGGYSERGLHYSAKARGEAAWGGLMVQLGDSAIGDEIAFDQFIEVSPSGQYAISLATMARNITPVSEESDEVLSHIANATKPRSAKDFTLQTALRWYATGMKSGDHRDQLLSFYIGVEANIRDHAARNDLMSGVSKVAGDEAFSSLLDPLADKFGREALDALIGRCKNTNPSPRECFASYAAAHKLGSGREKDFMRVNRLRNPATHGGTVAIKEQDAKLARNLLTDLLRIEMQRANHRL